MAFRVIVREGESVGSALLRLAILIEEDRLPWRKQRRPYYEKPSQVRRRDPHRRCRHYIFWEWGKDHFQYRWQRRKWPRAPHKVRFFMGEVCPPSQQ